MTSASAPSRLSFAELRAKYEEMLALRSQASAAHEDPKPRLAALASRFPGALREIDELPLDEIGRRIDALAHAERDPAAAKVWMHAMTRFHALARGALYAKRSLAMPASDWPIEAQPWRPELERVAKPPRGRLMDLVYEKLGFEFGMSPAAAKLLVFGVGRRAR